MATCVWLSETPRPCTLLEASKNENRQFYEVPCTPIQHRTLLDQMFPHEREKAMLTAIRKLGDAKSGDPSVDLHSNRAYHTAWRRLMEMRVTARRMRKVYTATWKHLSQLDGQLATLLERGANAAHVESAEALLRSAQREAVERILRSASCERQKRKRLTSPSVCKRPKQIEY